MTKWNDELDQETREALHEWSNYRSLDGEDDKKERLAQLYIDGNFSYWDCPECDTKIMVGQPDDWGHFQGVCQSEYIGQLCADCGAHYLHLKEYAD